MGTQEWLLLGVVLVVPLIVAIGVTLWTLEQAIKRNRKHQKGRSVRRVSEPVADVASDVSQLDDPAPSRTPVAEASGGEGSRSV